MNRRYIVKESTQYSLQQDLDNGQQKGWRLADISSTRNQEPWTDLNGNKLMSEQLRYVLIWYQPEGDVPLGFKVI